MSGKWLLVVLAGVLFTWVPGFAQTVEPDRGSLQAAGLFLDACMPFAGSADGIRAWAASKNIPEAAAAWSAHFLGGKAGKTFAIDTIGGEMLLVSYDEGPCALRVKHGDKRMIDDAFTRDIVKIGGTITPALSQVSASGLAEQTLFDVHIQLRHWVVSTTRQSYPDAPDQKPGVTLLATAGK